MIGGVSSVRRKGVFANDWAGRSFEVAYEPGYLDRLGEIYHVEDAEEREVPTELLEKIREAYQEGDDAAFVQSLFQLDKKPIDEPYMRLLQRLPEAVRQNPETVRRIARQHRRLSWPQLEGAIRAPIVANRQLGNRFSEWLKTLGNRFVDEDELLRSAGEIALLAGSDTAMTDFAKRHLGYTGDKRLDLLAKCGDRYVIGEAKFFGDYGGNQNNQLKDAMTLVENRDSLTSDTKAVAVLDGVVWIRGKSSMYKTVSFTEHDVMSALLLPEYLNTLI